MYGKIVFLTFILFKKFFFFFNDTATTEIYTLSLHDALPICSGAASKLKFSTNPPSSAGAGATWPSFTVAIYDTYGNPRNTGADSITVTEDHHTVNFSGTPTKTAVSGTAAFNDISFSSSGTLNVSATSGALAPAPPYMVTVTNTAPSISIIPTTRITVTEGDPVVPYLVDLSFSDEEGDTLNLTGEVSLDGGLNWDPDPVTVLGSDYTALIQTGQSSGSFYWAPIIGQAGEYD